MIEETPESAPEDSSNVRENSHAMEIEESPQDIAKSLDEALREKSILRSKSLKASHHPEFLKKCVEAGNVPRGLRIQQQPIHVMNSPDMSKM